MWRRTDPADPAARTTSVARVITIAATVVFALIVCRFQPWQLFIREAYSNDFYDEQARSFLRFRLAVRPEVPGPEGFLIDGKTYLYYGPFLALVRLPFAAFGDLFAGRLARLSMIVGFVAYCTACFHLVRHLGPAASTRRVAGFVAAAACSPVLFLAGWVSVYHETELWAAAFAVWAIVGTLRLIAHPSPTRHQYVAAAVPLAAGILTRASVGTGVAAGACVAVVIAFRSRILPRSEVRYDQMRRITLPAQVGVVLGASTLGFVLHAALNWAKFGSPTKLPGQLQLLSLNDPTRAAWFAGNGDSFFSPQFLSTTLVQYLRPDTVRLERLFPFIRYGPLATDHGSYPLETITPSASLTTSATLLFAAALVGVALIVRRRAWPLLALTLGGAAAAGPTFTIGFIGNRYLVDMLPALLVPAAVAFATLSLPTSSWQRVAGGATWALVAWGVWCNVSLALWTQQLKEPAFTEWRYRVDGWIFGDPAPALVDLAPGAPFPRDGVVALDRDAATGRCSGVYIAEQGVWVALERSNDGRRLSGTLALGGDRTLVAGGDIWFVDALVADGQVSFVAEVDGATVTGDTVALPDDRTISFDLVADPIVGQLILEADGEQVLFAFAGTLGAGIPGSGVSLATDPGDSLCRQLEARR